MAGAEATLVRHTPNLLIECNDQHQPDAVRRLGAWLAKHDYNTVFVDGGKVRATDEYDRGIENFIAVHRSRADVLQRLVERVTKQRRA